MTWEWHLDDNITSNEREPLYTYTKPGERNVSLTYTEGNNYYTKYKNINVHVMPIFVDIAVDNAGDLFYYTFGLSKKPLIDDIHNLYDTFVHHWPILYTGNDNIGTAHMSLSISDLEGRIDDDPYVISSLTLPITDPGWYGYWALIDGVWEFIYFTSTNNDVKTLTGFTAISDVFYRQTALSDTELELLINVTSNFYIQYIVDVPNVIVKWFYKYSNDAAYTFLGSGSTYTLDLHGKTPGYYDVKMVVSNDYQSATIIKEKIINLEDSLVTVAFTSDFVIGADNYSPLMVNFYPRTTGYIRVYNWAFGDDKSLQVTKDPNAKDVDVFHVYDIGDSGVKQIFSVSLTVSNSKYTEHVERENYITVYPRPPEAMFKVDGPSRSPYELYAYFVNLSTRKRNCLWDFGDGIVSTDFNPVHHYTQIGSYNVTLTVWNDSGMSTYTMNNAITITGGELPIMIKNTWS